MSDNKVIVLCLVFIFGSVAGVLNYLYSDPKISVGFTNICGNEKLFCVRNND